MKKQFILIFMLFSSGVAFCDLECLLHYFEYRKSKIQNLLNYGDDDFLDYYDGCNDAWEDAINHIQYELILEKQGKKNG